MKKRIAILISGGGSNMVQLLDSLTADHPGRAVLVVSNVPGAGGLQKAEARGVATAVLDHRPFAGDRAAFEAELSKILAAYKPDMICQAGFMRILTADFVIPWRPLCRVFCPLRYPRLGRWAGTWPGRCADPEK